MQPPYPATICNKVINVTVNSDVGEWFTKKVPKDWFKGSDLEVVVDNEEILIVGDLGANGDAGEATRNFRERTRDKRMSIASEAERLFHRKVAWGVRTGDERRVFTSLSVPVMTRLRITERSVLDTLVESGVARSRSDALAWCVRLVGKHEADWIGELREALVKVQEARATGPQV